MNSLFRRLVTIALGFGVALACGPGVALAAASSARNIDLGVVLTESELASVHGGQTVSGVITTVGEVAGYGNGMYVAGTVNAGIATTTISATIGTALGGLGAVLAAYSIGQSTFESDWAYSLEAGIQIFAIQNGYDVDGAVTGYSWDSSDPIYQTDLVLSTVLDQSMDEYYCGGVGCWCDYLEDCDSGLYCDSGYCADSIPQN